MGAAIPGKNALYDQKTKLGPAIQKHVKYRKLHREKYNRKFGFLGRRELVPRLRSQRGKEDLENKTNPYRA